MLDMCKGQLDIRSSVSANRQCYHDNKAYITSYFLDRINALSIVAVIILIILGIYLSDKSYKTCNFQINLTEKE